LPHDRFPCDNTLTSSPIHSAWSNGLIMPPRWLGALIVAFWLCTTGWLFYQNVWLPLLPGQPPPYTIDLEDEVQTRQAHIHWTVFYNGRKCLRAETWVEPKPGDETFALISELHPLIGPKDDAEKGPLPFGGLIEIRSPTTSTYRVTRSGDLRSVELKLSAVLGGLAPGEGTLRGDVRDGLFHAHLAASSPVFPAAGIDRDLDPVPVPAHGSILSPMHPVNRIAGLRPGQTWRLPLVDPVPMVLSSLFKNYAGELAPAAEEVAVTARVLSEKRSLTWNDAAVDCYVIEYQDPAGEFTAQTWVRADDGKVLRQEARRGDEAWALERDRE
jgi:hypothetical protein